VRLAEAIHTRLAASKRNRCDDALPADRFWTSRFLRIGQCGGPSTANNRREVLRSPLGFGRAAAREHMKPLFKPFAALLLAAAIGAGCNCGGTSSPNADGGSGIDSGSTDGGSTDGGKSDGGTVDAGSLSCVSGQNTVCPCDGGQCLCCDGVCVNSLTDPRNCAFCHVACPSGEGCVNGLCVSADSGTPEDCSQLMCPAGTRCVPDLGACLPGSCGPTDDGTDCTIDGGPFDVCCSGSCIGPESVNPSSCGNCREVCPSGDVCINDGIFPTCFGPPDCSGPQAPPVCICETPKAPPFCGLDAGTFDAGLWADYHCANGGCPVGTACVGAGCLPLTCGAEEQGQIDCALDGDAGVFLGTCCGGSCVDTGSDPSNCQVCGNVCPAGSFCNYGFCPVTDCAQASINIECILENGKVGSCCGANCVDPSSDPDNCGGCGIQCAGSGTCSGYVCSSGCPSLTCPAGTSCERSVCEPLGCSGFEDGWPCSFSPSQPGICCDGRCVDPNADPLHCGSCGTGNPSGHCIAGSLFPPAPGVSCSHGVCPVSDSCTWGAYCVGSTLVIDGGSYCGGFGFGLCVLPDSGPGDCCASSGSRLAPCVDVTSDSKNCGSCDVVCPQGQVCANGLCSGTQAPCSGGLVEGYCELDAGLNFLCCPGTGCTNVSTDSANCGKCGVSCSTDGGCVSGACR
jgi:hypothetical protein